MTKQDARTIAAGLLPTGLDVKSLGPTARHEMREAIDTVLRLWDHNSARLELTLRQLDRAADEIDRLRAELRERT